MSCDDLSNVKNNKKTIFKIEIFFIFFLVGVIFFCGFDFVNNKNNVRIPFSMISFFLLQENEMIKKIFRINGRLTFCDGFDAGNL